jgi:hypothetical protein
MDCWCNSSTGASKPPGVGAVPTRSAKKYLTNSKEYASLDERGQTELTCMVIGETLVHH